MRFNQEDLRRGNVSFERMKEVVLQTLYKLDNNKSNPENLQRIGSNLLSNVEKIFLFKKSEGNDKESLDKFNYEYNLSNLMFFDKLVRANLELIKTERVIEFTRQQEIQKAIQEQMFDLKMQNEQKRISDNAFQERIAQLNSEMIHQMMKQRDESLGRIQELVNHRNQLIESIQERQKAIQASRVVHQEEALRYVDQVKVGNVDTFEGMSKQNKERFVNGYFALDEIRTRKLTEIDIEIKAEMDAMAKSGSDQKKSAGLVQNYQNKTSKSWSRIEQLKQEKENINDQFKKNVIRLGDETGHEHINSSVSEEESTEHLEAFENQDNIRAEIDAHKAFTRQQAQEIHDITNEVIDVNRNLAKEIVDVKNLDSNLTRHGIESYGSALNINKNGNIEELSTDGMMKDLLTELSIDETFDIADISQLAEIDFDNGLRELGDLLDIRDCQLENLSELNLNLSELDYNDLDFTESEIKSKNSIQNQNNNIQMRNP